MTPLFVYVGSQTNSVLKERQRKTANFTTGCYVVRPYPAHIRTYRARNRFYLFIFRILIYVRTYVVFYIFHIILSNQFRRNKRMAFCVLMAVRMYGTSTHVLANYRYDGWQLVFHFRHKCVRIYDGILCRTYVDSKAWKE